MQQRDRVVLGVGFADDLDATRIDERLREPFANQRRIFHQQHSERGSLLHCVAAPGARRWNRSKLTSEKGTLMSVSVLHGQAPPVRRSLAPNACYSIESVLDGVVGEVRVRLHPHLLEDARPVSAHRLHRQIELVGDLGDRGARGELAEDLELALRQLARAAAGRRRPRRRPRGSAPAPGSRTCGRARRCGSRRRAASTPLPC